MTGLLRSVLNLVVEDRVVEGQSQPDGVSGLHVLFADLVSLVVGLLGGFHNSGALLARGHLAQVTVIISLHLQVEDLAFMLGVAAVLDQEVIQQVEHILAHSLQLLLNLLAVGPHHLDLLLVAIRGGLLLDAGDDPPG